ncbi:MAG: hypothetical protein J3K34DRAFT_279853 [Monoraphidium minutum]|nr:MAG: hypothetical protein J3K34DRAFT_279853 [Monoraphidium minutum]
MAAHRPGPTSRRAATTPLPLASQTLSGEIRRSALRKQTLLAAKKICFHGTPASICALFGFGDERPRERRASPHSARAAAPREWRRPRRAARRPSNAGDCRIKRRAPPTRGSLRAPTPAWQRRPARRPFGPRAARAQAPGRVPFFLQHAPPAPGLPLGPHEPGRRRSLQLLQSSRTAPLCCCSRHPGPQIKRKPPRRLRFCPPCATAAGTPPPPPQRPHARTSKRPHCSLPRSPVLLPTIGLLLCAAAFGSPRSAVAAPRTKLYHRRAGARAPRAPAPGVLRNARTPPRLAAHCPNCTADHFFAASHRTANSARHAPKATCRPLTRPSPARRKRHPPLKARRALHAPARARIGRARRRTDPCLVENARANASPPPPTPLFCCLLAEGRLGLHAISTSLA